MLKAAGSGIARGSLPKDDPLRATRTAVSFSGAGARQGQALVFRPSRLETSANNLPRGSIPEPIGRNAVTFRSVARRLQT
jgi:hypothetical protein